MANIAQTRFGQIVIGPPGSGKTTYVGAMAELLRLFLADVRIDYDSWRGSPVVTSNSRTVITVNPNTTEAASLLRHAQYKDFSVLSR